MIDFLPTGWIPVADRSPQQIDLHAKIVASMPRFQIVGPTQTLGPGDKVMLTDYWKHPATVNQLGFAFPGIHQITGSCVGAGGGNMLFTLNAVETILKGQLESIMVPFWLLPYGRSRYDEGDRGQGEGSMGSSFAQAVKEDGVLDANDPALPKYTNTDGLVWGQQAEMTWSDGGKINPDFLTESRKHVVQTFSQLHSADDVANSIINGYPVTRACGTFCNPGSESIQGSGDWACVVGKEDGQGGHQMTYLAVCIHPQLGRMFWNQNQWGLKVYQQDPLGGPAGGYWIPDAAVDKICRGQDSEVFSFSGLNGYPARNLLDFLPRT